MTLNGQKQGQQMGNTLSHIEPPKARPNGTTRTPSWWARGHHPRPCTGKYRAARQRHPLAARNAGEHNTSSIAQLLRRLGVFLTICLSAPSLAFADLPTAPVSFPFSLGQGTFTYEFHVEYYTYVFTIDFAYADLEDQNRILDLLKKSATPLAVHIKLVRLIHDSTAVWPIHDATIFTDQIYAIRPQGPQIGFVQREIVAISLMSGDYRVEVTAEHPSAELQQRPCRLEISTQKKYLPFSATPTQRAK
jgi:hypothetical protein